MLTLVTILLLRTAPVVAQSVTVDLSPQDAFLRLDSLNYSTDTKLSVYTWPTGKVADVSLLTFSLAAIPAGATVQSATLTLTLIAVDAGTEPTYAVTLHQVLVPVNVALASGTSSGVAPWTLNATCCGLANMSLAQSDIGPARATTLIDRTLGLETWDATAIVQDWLASPSTNFGLLLNADLTKPADRFRTFASMDAATGRPFLRVVYTTGPPPPPQSDLLPTSLLAWEVEAPSPAEGQTYPIFPFVDNIRRALLVPTCTPTVPPSSAVACQAVAPPTALPVGTHTIEITVTVNAIESARSLPITVTQLAATLVPPLPPTSAEPRKFP